MINALSNLYARLEYKENLLRGILPYVKPCASCGEPAPGNPYCDKCLNDPNRSLHYQRLQHEPLTGVEYQRFYDCGEMPERFWPTEIDKLRSEYAEDKITLQVFEDSLDDLMGITNA